MIRVRIDLISAVSRDRDRELGCMYIANDGEQSSADPKLGDYIVAVCRRGTDEVPRPVHEGGPKPTRAAEVKGYPRLAYNVWRLIARAVTAAFPEERHVKPGTLPLMESSVLRGLHFLAQHWAGCKYMAPDLLAGDVKAAIDWLGEANEVPLDITLEDETR